MTVDPLDPKILSNTPLIHAGQGEVDKLKNLAEGGAENLERVAAQFESIFLNFLIKQMWESVEDSGLLPESPGRKIYDGMLTTMLADHLAQNRGIGIADAIVNQLKRRAEAYEAQKISEETDESRPAEQADLKEITGTEPKTKTTH
jgi:flagellar protein FlgJ